MNVNDPHDQAKVAAEAMRLVPKLAARNNELEKKVAAYERRDRIAKIARQLWPDQEQRDREVKKLAKLDDAKLASIEVAATLLGTGLTPKTAQAGDLGDVEIVEKIASTGTDAVHREAEDARRRLDDLLLNGYSPDDQD